MYIGPRSQLAQTSVASLGAKSIYTLQRTWAIAKSENLIRSGLHEALGSL